VSGSHCIRILGRELQVRSSATPETVQEIEAFVNDTVARVESRVRGGDRLGVAILTLMTLAEEHLAVIKKQNKCNTEQVVELIRTIDEVLPGAA
jgi:cell division protein ZapA